MKAFLKNISFIVLMLLPSCGDEEQSSRKNGKSGGSSEIDRAETIAKEEIVELKDEGPEIKSIAQLWTEYNNAKNKAQEALAENNIESVINNLRIAGECALELGRPGIAAWQFNNIGNYSIIEFKRVTGYNEKINGLNESSANPGKEILLAETKLIFKKHIKLLEVAEKYLEKAQIIDDELEESSRTGIIQSNAEFIEWVKEFIR